MTASLAVAPMGAQPASASLLGLHGLKQRWLSDTVRDGLRRDSAAWFALRARSCAEEWQATVAACVYHALGLTVVADLASRTAPGGYLALFEAHPDQVPAILAFCDEPSSREIWRRYRWLGPPASARTAPYTKVQRAERTVGPWHRPLLFTPGLAELARIERGLDRRRLAAGNPRLVVETDEDPPVQIIDTKLARFCAAVGGLAEASLFAHQTQADQAQPNWPQATAGRSR